MCTIVCVYLSVCVGVCVCVCECMCVGVCCLHFFKESQLDPNLIYNHVQPQVFTEYKCASADSKCVCAVGVVSSPSSPVPDAVLRGATRGPHTGSPGLPPVSLPVSSSP